MASDEDIGNRTSLAARELRIARAIQQCFLIEKPSKVAPAEIPPVLDSMRGTRFSVLVSDEELLHFLSGGPLSTVLRSRLNDLCNSWSHSDLVAICEADLAVATAHGDENEIAVRTKELARLEQAHATMLEQASSIESLPAARALEILDQKRLAESDSLKRARYREAWLFLFLKVKQSNPRAAEWREALKALKKHAEKHAELFQRAQVALEGLADIHATDVAHCANPLPNSLAYLAATRAGAVTFRLLPALLQQRIDALGPTVSHRPTLDELCHVEAILSGRLDEIRTGERPGGALTFPEVAELNLDTQGVAESEGQSFGEEGADRVKKRVTRYLDRRRAEIEPIDEDLLAVLLAGQNPVVTE